MNAAHRAEKRKTRGREGKRLMMRISVLIRVMRRPAARVMMPPMAEKSAFMAGVM